MNILQHKVTTVEINGKVEGKHRELRYIPEAEPEDIFASSIFDAAYDNIGKYIPYVYTDESLLTHKPFILYRDSIKLTKKNFQSVAVSCEYRPVENPDSYSFDELSKDLPAKEFVEWLKDQGLGSELVASYTKQQE